MSERIPEVRESLWSLVLSPAVWAVHFLACYAGAAVSCEKGWGFDPARRLIAWLTGAAALAIALRAAAAWRRSGRGEGPPTREFDTDEDRHRFLGYAELLLAGLSLMGVLYAGGAALAFGSCE